jgi:surface polysaccharide O-acyltransferase-like enzyme
VPSRDRIVAYDALRVFAIVTVVAIHTLMPYRDLVPATAPVRVFDDLLHYAVPLFVFISGAFVWGRPLPSGPGAFRTFFSRRIAVVVVPYLAWSAVYLALLALTGARPLQPDRVVGLLLSGHTWYHLYFVPMLVTFYLLTPIARRVFERSPELLLIATYLLRILAGPAIARAVGTVLGDLGWAWATHVLVHLPHMALGAWFAVRHERLPRQKWFATLLLASGTAVLLAASLGVTDALVPALRRLVYPAGMAATVLGMALLALGFEPWLERYTPTIVLASALSFGVYFVHPVFILAVGEGVRTFASENLWFAPWFPIAVFAGITAASFWVSYVLARTRACRLVGVMKPLRAQSAAPTDERGSTTDE